ncbi:ribose-5-phosphate isomerase related protein [Thermoplasma acidophilum]|uniref:Ribose-5-phosphate isomerase A n=1 Tax=Thermoplasma acidophilum (strain ATCC 25905 / DSM 1728 / JCM 9062 / NBRC 15155 / AMRC-C165) TaxID=273075 RepID=RPIA_THEAC|nr:ribose 5-phosphate isomerase A [Thermoplasma acidophilum]Q9HJT5.1 RecName: Full=Ribose-5-phosphate isomerase A; AltName: Full=Phosphoriboisomerase A; Short=PRI [Thermoplasma acidophilum DSM 1728]MCY0851174.1 ribose 5-phosphate isomerase A [Thermoplasma acidophilum]CAC12007.1 ribose-5-phosphate isomerase related protein [Thermoplasma acidophilum]
MADYEKQKMNAAIKAAEYVRSGMIVGLGTGTTSYYLINEIGRRVREEGLKIRAVCTSRRTEDLAKQNGIEVIQGTKDQIDLTIDGADQVGMYGTLIKGGGGALLREKIVAYNSKEMYVIVDSRKIEAAHFGSFPLPVEIVPFMHMRTLENLRGICTQTDLRMNEKGEPFVTDNGNYIADMHMGMIDDPINLERSLKSIPGVVEVGLFNGIAKRIFEGTDEGCNIYSITNSGIKKEEVYFDP